MAGQTSWNRQGPRGAPGPPGPKGPQGPAGTAGDKILIRILLVLLAIVAAILLLHTPAHAQDANFFETSGSISAYTVATLPAGQPTGTLAIVTDGSGYNCTAGGMSTLVLCYYNGATWASVGPAAGAGTLTASGLSLPVNQIVLGNVYPDVKPLGSLGTTTTVYHGNAAGAGAFGAVVSADLNLTTTTCTNQALVAIIANGTGTCSTLTSAYTSGTFPANAHNLLSATHGDTTPAAAVRGDGLFAIGATPTWQNLAHPSTTGGYFKWNGTDIVASSGAASGTGTPTACSNQVVTALTLNADAAPTSTCTTISTAFLPGSGATTVNTNSCPLNGSCTIGLGQIGNPAATTSFSYAANQGATVGMTGTATNSWTTDSATAQFLNAKNTTAAIVGTSQGSPKAALCGRAFHGSADVEDCMTFGELPGNGNDAAITFSYGHSGTSTGVVTHAFSGAVQPSSLTASLPVCSDANKTLSSTCAGLIPLADVGSAGLSGTSPIAISAAGAISCGTCATITNGGALSGTSPVTVSAAGAIGCATCTVTIANGTSAMGTGAISSATCATVVTTSATGTATTDNIMADFNADPHAVTGYVPSTNGMLTIIKYPTTNNVNFLVCNNTSASITPGAITLNWRVVR